MKLTPVPHGRVWGTEETQPWWANTERLKIGEVWFEVPDSCPLLIKFLFTADKLSIQVHPGDCGEKRGKTEMWHVLRAEPGAKVALGVKREVTQQELREACEKKTVEDLLHWEPAGVGDTFFVPAGTVHALGGGLVVCEIQQNSDCTYRLYDYGRRRELHLDAGVPVSTLTPYNGRASLPFDSAYFNVSKTDSPDRDRFLIACEGERAGQAWFVERGPCDEFEAGKFLVAYPPQ